MDQNVINALQFVSVASMLDSEADREMVAAAQSAITTKAEDKQA